MSSRNLESASGRYFESAADRDLESGPVITGPITLKKGVGALIEATTPTDLVTLNSSWYYDWASYSTPILPPVTPGIEYVPMMWGDWINDPRWGSATGDGSLGGPPLPSVGGANVLLGFNEPNVPAQANMTVSQALALWPQLDATGARLGSPAVSGDPGLAYGTAWMSSFMSGNGGPVPRVDFVCAHWYVQYNGGYTNVGDYLDYLYTTYSKPIWITEIGSLGGTVADNAALMSTVMTALSTRPWVERIAWYGLSRNAANLGYTGSTIINTDGTLNAAGTVWAGYPAGPMYVVDPLMANTGGVATDTGALIVARALVGSSPGTSTTTGALAKSTFFGTASAAGGSTTTGSLIVARALVGTSDGVSSDSAALAVARTLAGTSAGTSTTTGDLTGSSAKTINGQSDGTSTTTGALTVARALVGSSTGAGTAAGTFLVVQRALVGTADGLSSVAGALAVARALAGQSDGSSTTSATSLASAGLPGGLSDGTSTVTGTLIVARALVGSAASVASTTAALSKAIPVAGSADGSSTTSGALTVARALVGSADGVATTTGAAIVVARALVATSAGVATTTGNLVASAAGGLAGFTSGSSTATGALSVARPLAGSSTGSGNALGTLTKAIPLTGAADSTSTAAGTLSRAVSLAGQSDGASSTGLTLVVARSLVGSSSGFSAAGATTLVSSLALVGTSHGVSTDIGALEAFVISRIVGRWNGQVIDAMQYGSHQVIDFLLISSTP
jgi:hypothetical protein